MKDSFIVCGKDIPEGYLHIVFCRDKYYLMLYDEKRCDNKCWFDNNLLGSVIAFAFEEFKVRF